MEILTIAKRDVPEYLHSTALYSALQDGDNSLISIPRAQMKKDMQLVTLEDLHALVATLHFWGMSDIPDELVNFVLESKLTREIYFLHEAFPEFDFLRTLADINSVKDNEKVSESLKGRCVKLISSLRSCGRPVPMDAFYIAAKAGSVESMKYLREHWSNVIKGVISCELFVAVCFFQIPDPWDEQTCSAAVEGGHLACLKYAHENGCAWDGNELLVLAAKLGHLDCLNYLFEQGASWSEGVCTAAAKYGHLTCLQRAYDQRHVESDKQELIRAINLAAVNAGHPECIMIPAISAVEASLCTLAAKKGNVAVLQRLHSCSYPWEAAVCTEAAARGHLECFSFAREHGCPWNQREVCRAAAESGSVECLRTAFHPRYRDDLSLCRLAAACGSLQCLQFLHEQRCPWHVEVCAEAAKYGHVHCLEFAREAGCPWDRRVCINAARFGHLPCLVYAHELGCPWDAFVLSQAALHGNLHCLQYLHEQGCSRDMAACERAAEVGHLDCLVYMIERGYLRENENIARVAAENGHIDCAKYVRGQLY